MSRASTARPPAISRRPGPGSTRQISPTISSVDPNAMRPRRTTMLERAASTVGSRRPVASSAAIAASASRSRRSRRAASVPLPSGAGSTSWVGSASVIAACCHPGAGRRDRRTVSRLDAPAPGPVLAVPALTVLDAVDLDGRPAALRAEGGTIVAVGAHVVAQPGDEVLDAGGALLVPGLVNGHTHAAMPLLR